MIQQSSCRLAKNERHWSAVNRCNPRFRAASGLSAGNWPRDWLGLYHELTRCAFEQSRGSGYRNYQFRTAADSESSIATICSVLIQHWTMWPTTSSFYRSLVLLADVSGSIVLAQLQDALRRVGDRADHLGYPFSPTPGTAGVLSSDKPEVVENSIKILQTQAEILDGCDVGDRN